MSGPPPDFSDQALEQETLSDLQIFFGRTPYLAGRHLLPDAQGTMDVSLSWPLEPILNTTKGLFAAFGSNLVTLAAPDASSHTLVVYAEILALPVAGDIDAQVLMFLQKQQSAAGSAIVQLVNAQMDVRGKIPLINTSAFEDLDDLNNPIPPTWMNGLKTVYVPPKYELMVNYFTGVGGTLIALTWASYTFPATQPLSTLINF